eukprot:jgi/Botrbrau1/13499/Bobra.0082s0092.1
MEPLVRKRTAQKREMVQAEHRLMEPSRVRLSLIFDDTNLEKAYKSSVSSTRKIEDILVWILATALFAQVCSQGAYGTFTGKILWVLNSLCLVCMVCLSCALFWGHPPLMVLKPVVVPPFGLFLNVLAKLTTSSNLHLNRTDGSLVKGVTVILKTAALVQAIFSLGLCSLTGSTMVTDLALLASLQFLHVFWNKPECQLLCNSMPELKGTFQSLASMFWGFTSRHPLDVDPVRACIALRSFLQVTVGGMLPIALAYRREMRERTAFLQASRIPFRKPTWQDFLKDVVIIIGVIVMSLGFISALAFAFPELHDLPMTWVEA